MLCMLYIAVNTCYASACQEAEHEATLAKEGLLKHDWQSHA